ncbi:MAG: polyprenyl synthetase family protein [Thermoanaerobaculia bacterium]|nr:polyprenyl synthetase family protein [Thermoanaerobaculia bacterium]
MPRGSFTATRREVQDPSRFLELVGPKLELVERELRQNFNSPIKTIRKIGDHILGGGGKRIRPSLVLLTSEMLGYDGAADIRCAAVVEFIHTASLVHDDVIDDADIRRGRESINYRWGNHLTVLVGDYLYTHAMKMALGEERLEIVDLLCDTTILLTEGEILALELKGHIDISADQYFDVIGRKTAALFGAACKLPAFLVGLPSKQAEELWNYGHNLGICFQLVDDLLDFTSNEETLGKPALADLKEGKLTLPLILAMPTASDSEKETIRRVATTGELADGDAESIQDIVGRYQCVSRTMEIARDYADRALANLSGFPQSTAREALEYGVEYVLDRDR